MNKTIGWIVGVVVVLGVGGATYIAVHSDDSMMDKSGAMMDDKKDGAMMDKSSTSTDAMMEGDKDGAMMKADASGEMMVGDK